MRLIDVIMNLLSDKLDIILHVYDKNNTLITCGSPRDLCGMTGGKILEARVISRLPYRYHVADSVYLDLEVKL